MLRDVIQNGGHRMRLAHAWGTRHHHAANVRRNGTLGQLAQHVKAILQVGEHLDIGARLLGGHFGTFGEHCLAGTTTTLNLESHAASLFEVVFKFNGKWSGSQS